MYLSICLVYTRPWVQSPVLELGKHLVSQAAPGKKTKTPERGCLLLWYTLLHFDLFAMHRCLVN
jgi:hypothetical protein